MLILASSFSQNLKNSSSKRAKKARIASSFSTATHIFCTRICRAYLKQNNADFYKVTTYICTCMYIPGTTTRWENIQSVNATKGNDKFKNGFVHLCRHDANTSVHAQWRHTCTHAHANARTFCGRRCVDGFVEHVLHQLSTTVQWYNRLIIMMWINMMKMRLAKKLFLILNA